jgi:thiol-disulfide isomerase/thioredoxin
MKYLFIILIVLFAHLYSSGQKAILPVHISGKADFLTDGDTVTLIVYKYGIINQEQSFQTSFVTKARENHFEFYFDGTNYPQNILIQFKRHYQNDLSGYIIQAGDNIMLTYQNEKLMISGKQSKSFAIQYQMAQLVKSFQSHHPTVFNAASLEKYFLIGDSMATEQNSLLQKFKHELSPQMSNFLQTNIFASYNEWIYGLLDAFGSEYLNSSANPILESFRKYNLKVKDRVIRTDTLDFYVPSYPAYIIEKYKVDSCLAMNRNYDIVPCLSYMFKRYSGKLREQLVMALICASRQFPAELGNEINTALTFIGNPDYRRVLQQILATRIEGAQAFNFHLTDMDGRSVQLSDFKNEVVVLDFWFTGCFSCRQSSPYIASIEKEFVNRPVKFISISIDKNEAQWQKSVKSGEYVSPDIINLYTNGDGIRNPAIHNFNVLSFPTLIIITRTGKVVNVDADARYDQGAQLRQLITDNLK